MAKIPRDAHPHQDAIDHIRKVDPILYRASLPHLESLRSHSGHRRSYAELFAALAGSIVSQQLSTKAADTIWGRLKDACKGSVTPEAILRLRAPTLRKAGLSAAKVKSLKELSKAITSGTLDLKRLKTMPEEEAVAALSSIWGIGRWTAEMFLMFALGRKDVFSPGDLALVRAMETLYGMPRSAQRREFEARALVWSPYRTFASLVLWKTRDPA
ncbi:MAG TPA: DNA-3-methyladenine glycosylase 2 family protein [Candidatus Paceibacterota bacterium]|nr:DNA-3-methyladenine glycosylase 2 family protein [Candidatus Paceibacterota bacterium]